MHDLRGVVVATDFSAGAERAMRRAAALADEHGLPLELLHVVSAPALDAVRAWFRDPADIAERLVADARQSLEAAAAASAATGTVRTRLAVGDVQGELEAACDPGVLLVLGAHGTNTLGDLLFGSTAERVVRECAGPVLVVRNEGDAPYRNVLVGVDLESGCATLLANVAALAPGARLTALHAYDLPFEGTLHRAGVRMEEIERQRGEALKAALERIGAMGREATGDAARVLPLAERGDPARLLVEHGRRIGADLLAVARRSRSAIEALLLGSVARRVVSESDRDVLVLRGPATP